MASRTIFRRINILACSKQLANFGLIRRRYPGHVGDFGNRPEIRFRIAMALQTPAHAKHFFLLNYFHLSNIAVTGDTANSGVYMNAVIKIGEIRKVVNPSPFQRFFVFSTVAYQLKLFRILLNQGMTVHAGCCWRNVGGSSKFNSSVTVAAVDAQISGMKLMTVINRLNRTVANISIRGRGIEPKKPGAP